MSSGGNTTTTTKQDPWKPIQPYLTGAAGTAQNLYNSGVGSEYYPFSTYVPASNQTNAAWNMTEQLAGQNPAYNQAAATNLTDTLNGTYLGGGNPYLNQIYNRGANDITDRVNAQMSMSGRTGSGAHAGVLADSLGDYNAQLFGGQYAQERDNQMRGMMMAPALDASRYAGAQQLANVGAGRESYAQAQLQSMMNRHDFMQQNPWDRYNNYLQAVGLLGGMGGSAVNIQPNQGNSALTGALGGASTGASIGSAIPGIGTAVGAGVGGILGFLGGS